MTWLVRTVVLKPPDMIQQALDLLEKHQGEWWYGSVATPIRGVFWCGVSERNRPTSPEGVWRLCAGVTGPSCPFIPVPYAHFSRLSVLPSTPSAVPHLHLFLLHIRALLSYSIGLMSIRH